MSNQQIFEKAIAKVIDGGWSPGREDRRTVVSWGAEYSKDFDEGEGVMIIGYHAKSEASMWFFPINTLIFNHDFAKALWGEELVTPKYTKLLRKQNLWWGVENCSFDGALWQYHLQMMVIAPDPIKYLGDNI